MPPLRRFPFLVLLSLLSFARANPGPGDTYREFTWLPEGKGPKSRWQRITGPDTKNERAMRFLPNPVNKVLVTDLAQAERAKLQLELLQCHVGTIGHAFRINGGDWVRIPPSSAIPGKLGASDGHPQQWQSMRYPSMPVAVGALKEGENTLEFTCKPGFGLGSNWPQSLINGAILRVYYGAAKSHVSGRITVSPPRDPATAGVQLTFALEKDSPSVDRVDYIGHYLGFDWRGEGSYLEWHYNFRRGELTRHFGGADRAPWSVHWDTSWVPVQSAPVQVMARITDSTGLCHLTQPIPLADLNPPKGQRVQLIEPYAIPPRWHVRANRRMGCKVRFPDDLSRLREVRVILCSWNGHGADTIGINDTVMVADIGRNHDLSYDVLTVPIGAIKPGENEFVVTSKTKEHGIEVQWPGFVVLARFSDAEAPEAEP